METLKNILLLLRNPSRTFGLILTVIVSIVILSAIFNSFSDIISFKDQVKTLVKPKQPIRPKRKVVLPTKKIKLPIHDQEDSELVKYVRSMIIPPAPPESRYSLTKKVFDPSKGQGRLVMKLTHFLHDGFFFECGAKDGEHNSHTLLLERHLGWKGLLVESYPDFLEHFMSLNRRSWYSPTCLSHNTSAYDSIYVRSTEFVGLAAEKARKKKRHRTSPVRIPCFPFYTFVLAMNVTKIDYLSIDVADNEPDVLEAIPFRKLNITVVSVEITKTTDGHDKVMDVMVRKGYKTITRLGPDDLVFVKKDYHVPYDTHKDLLK